MKTLNPALYETLTPRQRVIATIEAEARGDEEEVQRLVKSCPKKTYIQTDAAYTDTMHGLMIAALAVESDLRGMALICFASLKRNPDQFDSCAQRMADVNAAWEAMVQDYGLAPEIIAKAIPIRHPLLDYLLQHGPPPDPEAVREEQKLLERWLDRG